MDIQNAARGERGAGGLQGRRQQQQLPKRGGGGANSIIARRKEGVVGGGEQTLRVCCLTDSWIVLPVASTVLPASSTMRGVGLEPCSGREGGREEIVSLHASGKAIKCEP